MIKKLKTLIFSLALLLTPAVSIAVPATVSAADIRGSLCRGADLQIDQSKDSCETADSAGETFNGKIARVINILSAIIGVVAVIMIIFAGFRYITSGGAQDKVKGAKDTILYALIGLVIVALAQVIVKFVLKNASSN